MSIKETQLERGLLAQRCYATLHSVTVDSGIRITENKTLTEMVFVTEEDRQENKLSIDMRRLTAGIRSEKCVGRRFHRCTNVYLHKPRQYSLLHT